MAATNLAVAFLETVRAHGSNIALLSKKEGNYVGVDYDKLHRQVKNLALGLAASDIRKGDRVSIFSFNRPEWAISDLAIISLGAINVPLYPTLSAKQLEFIINDAEVKFVIVSGEEQTEKILQIRKQLKYPPNIILMDNLNLKAEGITTLAEVSKKGEVFSRKNPDYLKNAVAQISPDDICAIVYTSGTTGDPKGVMLSHGNILGNVRGALKALNITHTDRFLSFLPLSHVFERMAGQFCPIVAGGAIAYAESPEKVVQNMAEAKPTITCTVPRLLEKMHDAILAKVNSGSLLKKKMFFWGLNTGYRFNEAKKTGKISGLLQLQRSLAQKLVFKKIHAVVGGRLRYFISGGAPLPKEIGEFFHALGVNILEGYGLTESSPVISVNLLGKMKFGTVGPPLREGSVEVKIGSDGEILTRGPHVMPGYYKNPDATREVIDEDGWLHTGDIGFQDEDGYLTITDRKKNLIVTSGGKNISPTNVENSLLISPLIDQIVVIGDRRNFIAALIVPNRERLEKETQNLGIASNDYHSLLRNEKVISTLHKEIEKLSMHLARFERVRAFRLLGEPFTIESGELTPTLKVRRNIVEEKYRDLIEEMYQEND
ncbi:hypothetical protein B6D60_09455 [candidate division KSB1 bacterium 4484_87]|nr:MAG: hypothetical protein B6D60_09455 [candidate division KSB1 bacterium 4484_87]